MIISKYLVKKTYKISKIYNKIHTKLQLIYKIFEKITCIHFNQMYKKRNSNVFDKIKFTHKNI